MKKIICFILASLMLTCLFGCSDEDIKVIEEIAGYVAEELTEENDINDAPVEETPEAAEPVVEEKPVTNVEDLFGNPAEDIVEEADTEEVTVTDKSDIPSTDEFTLDIDGTYTTAEDVSLYLYLYDDLPENFITKDEARDLGWTGGGLEKYAPGKCIGGDYFGNREGLLPKEKGRTYTECDINTLGKSSRGAERIVFSNDGLIFYTDDHYESFVLLYDEEGKAA